MYYVILQFPSNDFSKRLRHSTNRNLHLQHLDLAYSGCSMSIKPFPKSALNRFMRLPIRRQTNSGANILPVNRLTGNPGNRENNPLQREIRVDLPGRIYGHVYFVSGTELVPLEITGTTVVFGETNRNLFRDWNQIRWKSEVFVRICGSWYFL